MLARLKRQMIAFGCVVTGAALAACAPTVVIAPEPRTEAEATMRAADREAPTGALIIKKPDAVAPAAPR